MVAENKLLVIQYGGAGTQELLSKHPVLRLQIDEGNRGDGHFKSRFP